jgi:predicted nucleotidyltransferase
VKRSEATKRIEGLLASVVNGEGSYLPRVREVWIFGSYARGALEVGDVDLAVEFDQTTVSRPSVAGRCSVESH